MSTVEEGCSLTFLIFKYSLVFNSKQVVKQLVIPSRLVSIELSQFVSCKKKRIGEESG